MYIIHWEEQSNHSNKPAFIKTISEKKSYCSDLIPTDAVIVPVKRYLLHENSKNL